MPSQPPIPPLLSSTFSNLPYTSLTLLTSTLGATTSWLVVRFICAALRSRGSEIGHGIPTTEGHLYGQRVVLVSWLRDGAWWRESGRKLVKGSYVLGSGLFGAHGESIGADDCLHIQGMDLGKLQLVDGLSSGLGLNAGGIADVEKAIMRAIGRVESLNDRTSVILVLDGLEFLLAATECEVLGMLEMIGELREVHISSNLPSILGSMHMLNPSTQEQHVHATIIASATDPPFPQSRTTPLDISHTAFVMSLAHQARSIVSVRGLDTGTARDVSGVLRTSKGAGESADDGDANEMECLYYVSSDGGVNVFERGA